MLKLGKVFGAPIILTTNLLIYIAVFCGFTLIQTGIQSAITTLLAISAVASCVLLHEIGHIAAGKRYGIRPNNITLNFFGGVASANLSDWYRLMDQPKKAMIVWICGPLVNIWVIILLTFTILGLGQLPTTTPYLSTIITDLSWVRSFNFTIAIFNLLPLYPLDGGGIFYSFCRLYTNKLKAIKIASMVSMIGCGILLILAIKYRALFAGIIAILIFIEAKMAPRSELFL